MTGMNCSTRGFFLAAGPQGPRLWVVERTRYGPDRQPSPAPAVLVLFIWV